jgi:hypothetical protein
MPPHGVRHRSDPLPDLPWQDAEGFGKRGAGAAAGRPDPSRRDAAPCRTPVHGAGVDTRAAAKNQALSR